MTQYTSGIVSYGDMFTLMRQAAELKNNRPANEPLIKTVLQGDAFRFASENDAKRKSFELARRLEYLDSRQISWLAGHDLALSKQVNLYCILRRDQLFLEFMKDVYCRLNRTFTGMVTRGDVMGFMNQKALESETVAQWTDYIRKRLCTEYFRILVRCGYGELKDESLVIAVPVVASVFVDDLIAKGQGDMAYVLKGGRP